MGKRIPVVLFSAENKRELEVEMKKKLILGLAVVLMIAALFVFMVMPAMSPDVGAGIVAGESSPVAAMELAVIDSNMVLLEDNAVPVSASIAEISLWSVLGAILVTFAVVCSRRLPNFFDVKNASLRLSNDSTDEGAFSGGGPNKFILPAAV